MTDSLQVKNRLASIDILRGLVIIFMALDHTRDFWGATDFSPTDLQHTNLVWFFTRWITHFCAPVFVLLSGVSTYLYGQKCTSKKQLSQFLLSRGLWLVVLELTLVNLSWQFDFNFVFIQVIWVIGISMIILAGLIHLPVKAIAATSLAVVLLHGALDDQAIMTAMGSYAWVWELLHKQGWIPLTEGGFGISVTYPIMPWFAVMALGYLIGPIFLRDALTRRRTLLVTGAGLTLLFIILRVVGGYGDPTIWHNQGDLSFRVMAFLNTTKYPAFLQFLCMTLGPSMVLLALFERWDNRFTSVLNIFGKVSLFFYLIHVPVINFAAHIWTYLVYGSAVNFFYGPRVWPTDYTPSLVLTYAAWIVLLLTLYLPCRWYSGVKAASRNKWLSYL